MTMIVPLDRSTPAWPTQLGRYAQKTRSQSPSLQTVALNSNINRQEVYGEWERFVHPSGATYYYNETRNTYTGLNVRDCPSVQLEDFENWVKAMRSRVNGDHTIITEPARTQNVDGDIYLYYLVAPEAEDLNLRPSFATIFSNKEVMEKIIDRLASLDDLSVSDGIIPEPGVALFGHRPRKWGPFPFIATITMLCLPMLVRERLDQIYVDGIVNSLDIKIFVDDFRSQNTTQITLAGVIMAIDTGFLAVQGAYYLDQGAAVVIGVFSAPHIFCMMRQANF
ncbi:hypothetical protein F4604DRAFT_1680219 [Suillus subluteus]|nr:hypothetical protein F4604DRAFT_1680219 [Suillus subluteus]